MSAITFLRRQLGYKGKSEHWGRGFYVMMAHNPVTYEELKSKIESKLDRWKEKGYVESYTQTDEDGEERIELILSSKKFGPYYRTFRAKASGWGWFGESIFGVVVC